MSVIIAATTAAWPWLFAQLSIAQSQTMSCSWLRFTALSLVFASFSYFCSLLSSLHPLSPYCSFLSCLVGLPKGGWVPVTAWWVMWAAFLCSVVRGWCLRRERIGAPNRGTRYQAATRPKCRGLGLGAQGSCIFVYMYIFLCVVFCFLCFFPSSLRVCSRMIWVAWGIASPGAEQNFFC